jgi:hypothetical protein
VLNIVHVNVDMSNLTHGVRSLIPCNTLCIIAFQHIRICAKRNCLSEGENQCLSCLTFRINKLAVIGEQKIRPAAKLE